ncbi:unnamed protein product, partial [Scytosiphon promiscuus]
MGTTGSKPDWYPGEPADNFNAPQCSCNQEPHPTSRHTAEASPTASENKSTAASPDSAAAPGSGARQLKKGERDITRLPVVALTDMQFIANGAFCAVYACKYRGWSVVAKRVRQDLPLSERKAALANLWTEYDCLRPLSHPNVIDAYGMCRVRCREGYDDWNEKDVCLLLEELAFGTIGHLFETIVPKEKNLSSAMARSRKMKMVPFRCRLHRALELAQALEYVHEGSGVGPMLHRDIKSVNVGFARNGSLKLMDFGLAKQTPIGAVEDGTYKMTGEVGSYRYMAPELVKHEPYNSKVDIYSWAILSWEILAIDKPYTGINESTFVKKVVLGGDRPDLRKSWPDRLCKLLASAWHSDHTKRPTAAEIVTVLKIVHAELAPRDKRRPSYAAKSGGGGKDGGGSNRRHSWTPQVSSTTPSALGLTRAPSGSGTTVGDGSGNDKGNASAAGRKGNGSAPRPLSSSFSPIPPGDPALGRKHASLPVPLTPSVYSTSTRRRWFPTRKKAAAAATPRRGVGSELACMGEGAPSGRGGGEETAQPGPSPDRRHRSRSVPEAVVANGEEACGVDIGAQGRAPEWTAPTACAGGNEGAASAGAGRVNRCELHQTLVSQREMIADALRRETEGLM